jgi:hypothetical protein
MMTKLFRNILNENKNNKQKKIFLSLSVVMLIFFFIGGIIVNLPILLLISVYALLITNYSLLNNKKIFNSLSIPLTFTYFFVMIYDFSQFNILFALFHIVTVIPCFIIIFRLNVSLIIMLGASFLYALWIFCIMTFLEFPYYQCIFGVCDQLNQFLIVLIIGVITSLISSKNRIKITIVQFIKKKLNLLVEKNV